MTALKTPREAAEEACAKFGYYHKHYPGVIETIAEAIAEDRRDYARALLAEGRSVYEDYRAKTKVVLTARESDTMRGMTDVLMAMGAFDPALRRKAGIE